MPSCGLAAFGSVRTSANIIEHQCAYDVHTLWPLTMKSSPSRTAVVRTAARSDPAPGSENPCAHHVSLRRIAGR